MTQNKIHEYRLFGRRLGSPLSPRQQQLMAELLPQFRLPAPVDSQKELQLGDVFPDKFKRFQLEIGFGGAEHLVWQAQKSPGIGFIGCEPFINGVVKLLTAIAELKLVNVRIDDRDARDLLDGLPASSFEKIYVLFPDPWPKQRHKKRRIISQKFLDQLARVMIPGASLCFASDIPDYISWMHSHIADNKFFEIVDREPEERPKTRYEQKAERAGRTSVYLEIICTK